MKRVLIRVYVLMTNIGIDPLKSIRFLKGLPFFIKDLLIFFKQRQKSNLKDAFSLSFYPIFDDKYKAGGTASGHYFHQDLLVSQRIFENTPNMHMDIGSRVDGFVAHVAAFREIEVLDVRSTATKVHNISFKTADLMNISDDFLNYCDSLSCLHALEHFGLGRYNDPVQFDGHLLGLENMHKILKTGGKFYFSVPIGKQRIEFNAHKVFSVQYLLSLFEDKFNVDYFSFVDDKGDLHTNIDMNNKKDINNNFGCHFGCGIFEMTKL